MTPKIHWLSKNPLFYKIQSGDPNCLCGLAGGCPARDKTPGQRAQSLMGSKPTRALFTAAVCVRWKWNSLRKVDLKSKPQIELPLTRGLKSNITRYRKWPSNQIENDPQITLPSHGLESTPHRFYNKSSNQNAPHAGTCNQISLIRMPLTWGLVITYQIISHIFSIYYESSAWLAQNSISPVEPQLTYIQNQSMIIYNLKSNSNQYNGESQISIWINITTKVRIDQWKYNLSNLIRINIDMTANNYINGE